MSNVFSKLETLLQDAAEAARLTNASFGFPNDRIEVKHAHFGGEAKLADGTIIHPDEFIKRTVSIHHRSWIIGPIEQALAIIRANEELLDRCTRLSDSLAESTDNLQRIAELARGSRKC